MIETETLLTPDESKELDAAAAAVEVRNVLNTTEILRSTENQSIVKPAPNKSENPKNPPQWDAESPRPVMHTAAYYGLAGKIVNTVNPETEAAAEGILFETLAAFGSIVGRRPYVALGAAQQCANIYLVKIGATAKARKGQGWSEVKRIFRLAASRWAKTAMTSGLSTGEGLIASLAPREEGKDVEGNVITITPDPRALIVEPEFAKILRVAAREKNTLIDVLRDAWDGVTLRIKTRANPIEADGTHVSIIGHCTIEEISKEVTDVIVSNGFLNRFVFCYVVRARELPFGGNLSEKAIDELANDIREKLKKARDIECVSWSPEAETAWKALYLGGRGFPDESGLAGSLIARGETHTIRWCLLFALMDGVSVITLDHVRAAYACWRYSADSARYIFGARLGDATEQRLLEAAQDVYPDGLDGVAQDRVTGGKGTPRARKALIQRGLLREEARPASGEAGRHAKLVYAVPPADKSDLSDKSNPLDDPGIFPPEKLNATPADKSDLSDKSDPSPNKSENPIYQCSTECETIKSEITL